MLRSQTFKSALPLAEHLDSKKKVAIAKPNTVLSELVALSIPSFETEIKSKEDLDSYAFGIELGTDGSLDNPSQHGLLMDGIIDDLSKMVKQHISIAKNDVKPIVVEFANTIQNYLTTNKTKSPSDEFCIQSLHTPLLLEDESFLDSIKGYIDRPILKPTTSINLGLKTKEEIISYMMVGSGRLDKLTLEWISSQDDNFVLSIWNGMFTTLSLENIITYETLEKKNVFEKANDALAIYLIARKIYDDVLEVDGLDLNRYKDIIAQIRDYAGSLLASTSILMSNFIQTKMLVIDLDRLHKTIKVNGSLYKNWLQQGGTPEVMLGLLISDRDLKSQGMIDEVTDELKAAWASYQTFFLTKESNNSFEYYRNFIYNLFYQSLDSKIDIENDFIEKNPNYLDVVKKLFNEEFDKLKTSDMSDVYKVSLCLIAKCRFYYTAGYDILSDINEAGIINPNISVREAALLAAINYVSDYLVGQISVSNA